MSFFGVQTKGLPGQSSDRMPAGPSRRFFGSGNTYVTPGVPYRGEWSTQRGVDEGMLRSIWAYKAIDSIAKSGAILPIDIRRGQTILAEDVIDPTDSKLWKRLNFRANPYEFSYGFRYRLITQLLLSKRGVFIEFGLDRNNNVTWMQLCNPDRTAPIPDERTFVSGYEITSNGVTSTVAANRMLWIRIPHPIDPYASLTPLEAAGLSIDLDHYSRLYNRNFMQADGRPGGIVSVKGGMGDDDAEIIRERFTNKGKPGAISVIESEGLDFVDLATTPRDAAYSELRKQVGDEVLIAFGVPKSQAGDASGRCVDDETEALTQRGWLHGDEITTEDTILSMDPADGKLKWSPVHEVYRAHYSGPMHRLRHKHADFLVTPGHNWAVETRPTDRRKGVEDPFTLRKVEDLSSHDRIIAMGEAEDSNVESEYSDAFVELVGWAVTEGSYQPNAWTEKNRPGLVAPYVRICQKDGPNIDRITACLEDLGASFVQRMDHDRPMWRWDVRGSIAAQLIAVSPERIMTTEFILALTAVQRERLLQTMVDGDGCRQASTTSWTFAQKDKRASEAFVLLATLCGYTTSMRERQYPYRYKGVDQILHDWIVIVRQRKVMTAQRDTLSIEEHEGTVWCPRTDYGTFVARRNGRTVVTGNTYDNADAEENVYWRITMAPILRFLDLHFSSLTPGGDDDDLWAVHNLESVQALQRPIRENEQRLMEQFKNGAIYLDELRVGMKRPPLEVPGSTTIFIPGSQVGIASTPEEAEQLKALITVGAPAPPDMGEEPEPEEPPSYQTRLDGMLQRARAPQLAAGPVKSPETIATERSRDAEATAQRRVDARAQVKSDGEVEYSMIALKVPADAASSLFARSSVPPTATPDDAHVTMVLSTLHPSDEEGMAVLKEWAQRTRPIEALIGPRTKVFPENDDGRPFVMDVTSDTLTAVRQDLRDTLEQAGYLIKEYVPYQPHMTIAYLPKGTDEIPEVAADAFYFNAFESVIMADHDEYELTIPLGGDPDGAEA